MSPSTATEFTASPVPPSAALWGAIDADEPVPDATLRRTVSAMMASHGALRAVVAGTTVRVPEEPLVTADDVIAEERSGPGVLAASMDPEAGLVWRVSYLSPTRILVCVHRGVVDAASWATVIGDVRTLLSGGSVGPVGSWPWLAADVPPAAIDGGGPATYKTFDVSDAEALLDVLPPQLGVGHQEILAAAVVIARAAAGHPIDTVALRARTAPERRTVGRLDQQFSASVPHTGATESELLTGAPVVRDIVDATASLLDASVDAERDTVEPDATVEVSEAKISVTGPVRPVDGVPHVILGTQALARVSVVDERGGADGVLLWRWLEQALISLAALARLTDAGIVDGTAQTPQRPVPAQARNLFGTVDHIIADRTVDLTHLPEVNGFAVAKRLQDGHPGGSTLVLLPGVTDPKATGGRSGRVGSGVTARLITPVRD